MTHPRAGSIAFIGGGNMARSLIGGLLARGGDAGAIAVAEPHGPTRERLAADFGVQVFEHGTDAVGGADMLVLAVKPQVMRPVCKALAPALVGRTVLVVSVAAGVRTDQIDAWLGGGRSVVRVMPNTPALVGAGAAGMFANARVDARQRDTAQGLLEATGRAVWIEDEALMDAVTAVSGSGPAYVFLLAEALAQAGRAAGLPAVLADRISRETIAGAGQLLRSSDLDPARLRQNVTSPGGTTAAALAVLMREPGGLQALMTDAVAAATARSREMGG
jgi:pyrroline-5-carboxylate reductase